MSDTIFPIPIPSLVAVLKAKEREKGASLTEQEVLNIRDNCDCKMGGFNEVRALEEARGYVDINPERVWEQWMELKSQTHNK